MEKVRKDSQIEMMEYMEPSFTERGLELDNNILSTDVVGLAYSQYLNKAREIQVYDLLTGGADHSYNINDAKTMLEIVDKYFKYKKAPEIDAREARDVEGFGEAQQIIQNLHSVVNLLNPSATKKGFMPSELKVKEALEIAENIKNITGDLFVSSEAMGDFKTFAISKAIDKLGIDNVALGIDLRTSLGILAHDISINNGSENKMILPDWRTMKGRLDSAKKRLGDEAYRELVEYYETMYNALQKSNFPVEFRADLVEGGTGEWVKSLQNSLAAGKMMMDKYSVGKAGTLAEMMTGELTRIEKLAELIKLGQNAQDAKGIENSNKALTELMLLKRQLSTFQKDLSEAITNQNPYTLRALSKMDVKLKDLIVKMSTQVEPENIRKYYEELANIYSDLQAKQQTYAFNEVEVKDFLVNELSKFRLPEKDVQDKIIKISTNQFMSKYRLSKQDIDAIFEFDKRMTADKEGVKQYLSAFFTSVYNPDGNMKELLKNNPDLLRELTAIENTLNTFANQLVFDVSTPEGRTNFENFIVKPLKLKVEIGLLEYEGKRPRKGEIDSDIYSMLSNHYGKRTVKRLEIYQKDGANKLLMDDASVSNVTDRGFMAIIDLLDPSQNNIYLVKTSGVNAKGKVIQNIKGNELESINHSLAAGGYEIIHIKGKSDAFRLNNMANLNAPNRAKGDFDAKYKVVPLNESTSILIRTDMYNEGLHAEIAKNFRIKDDTLQGDKGGILYQKLKEIYRGDLSGKEVSDLLNRLQSPKTDADLITAIKLTRTIIDFPLEVKNAIASSDFEAINQTDVANRRGSC